MNRRAFFRNHALPWVLGGAALQAGLRPSAAQKPVHRVQGAKLKLSCNLFSFNVPLTKGDMTLESVFDFCAGAGFDAVDPTGYYFPGYPKIPTDGYINSLKRRAFINGLDISGTGVRNDFTEPDAAKRKIDEELVRQWLEVAARLGAPTLRVFAGKGVPAGKSEDEVHGWIVESLGRCIDHAKKAGVVICLQNHHDFIHTSDQLLRIMKSVDSEWLGVNLDIGSFRDRDAYEEIEKVLPFTVTCQIKQTVFFGTKETKTDLVRLFRLFKNSGYRGYLPIETLGPGDPKTKVPLFLEEVRSALA